MVDSIRIYNKTYDKYIDLDKYSAMFLLDDEGVDWGIVTPTINTYASIYGLGSKVSNITFQKARVITITGWIINDNTGTISQKKKLLNQFVNPMNEIQLEVLGKYYISGTFTNSVKYTNKRKENNDTVCKFQLSITCSDPFFRLIKPLVYKDIPVNYNRTWTGWDIYINNPSGIEYGFELYLKFTEGLTVPIIDIQKSGSNKRTSSSSMSGNVYLSTVKGKYSFGNVDSVPTDVFPEQFNKLHLASSDFEFVQLDPGVNRLLIACGLASTVELGDSTIDIYFNPLILGFEEM